MATITTGIAGCRSGTVMGEAGFGEALPWGVGESVDVPTMSIPASLVGSDGTATMMGGCDVAGSTTMTLATATGVLPLTALVTVTGVSVTGTWGLATINRMSGCGCGVAAVVAAGWAGLGTAGAADGVVGLMLSKTTAGADALTVGVWGQ